MVLSFSLEMRRSKKKLKKRLKMSKSIALCWLKNSYLYRKKSPRKKKKSKKRRRKMRIISFKGGFKELHN